MVWANFLIAANGATTLHGSSSSLSSPRDRRRFHDLRAEAKAIVIGGNTFRREPYRSSPLPLFVATRGNIEMLRERNPLASFLHLSPQEIVEHARKEVGDPILIEAGGQFLSPLLRNKAITNFRLTRSKRNGDGDFYLLDDDLQDYQCVAREEFAEEDFEVWVPRST